MGSANGRHGWAVQSGRGERGPDVQSCGYLAGAAFPGVGDPVFRRGSAFIYQVQACAGVVIFPLVKSSLYLHETLFSFPCESALSFLPGSQSLDSPASPSLTRPPAAGALAPRRHEADLHLRATHCCAHIRKLSSFKPPRGRLLCVILSISSNGTSSEKPSLTFLPNSVPSHLVPLHHRRQQAPVCGPNPACFCE